MEESFNMVRENATSRGSKVIGILVKDKSKEYKVLLIEYSFRLNNFCVF